MSSSISGNLSRMVKDQRGTLSQSAFAEKIGITQSQISNYENGSSLPRLEQIEALAADRGILPEEYVAELYGRPISEEVSPIQKLLRLPKRDRIQAAIALMKSLDCP